mmetsp:Transcript_37233/g.86846  ORF Transcript_37233/g.86846 Transcript_37233/m.86846 type:complete len:290 (-) Transcript_37233:960-1829(-)
MPRLSHDPAGQNLRHFASPRIDRQFDGQRHRVGDVAVGYVQFKDITGAGQDRNVVQILIGEIPLFGERSVGRRRGGGRVYLVREFGRNVQYRDDGQIDLASGLNAPEGIRDHFQFVEGDYHGTSGPVEGREPVPEFGHLVLSVAAGVKYVADVAAGVGEVEIGGVVRRQRGLERAEVPFQIIGGNAHRSSELQHPFRGHGAEDGDDDLSGSQLHQCRNATKIRIAAIGKRHASFVPTCRRNVLKHGCIHRIEQRPQFVMSRYHFVGVVGQDGQQIGTHCQKLLHRIFSL